jgi:hypothetical protein
MIKNSAFADEESALWSSSEERRASVRHRVPLRVAFRLVDDAGGCAGEAPVRDLSNLGIGLILPQPLQLSALVDIELRSARSLLVRPVLARVVHIVEETLRSWIVGCAFTTELTAEELSLFNAEAVRPKVPDSRRWVRFPCNVETVCYTWETSPGERRPARILNISPGGIGLLLPCQFTQGTLLNFELPSGMNRPDRTLLVRVARVIEQSPGVWFLGCEFVHRLDDDELRMLLR